MKIQDWPSSSYRGTMVDVGVEAPQPTEDKIKRQLDFPARWKANQYCFYSEVGIELRGYSFLKREGRFTQEQGKRIISYGQERSGEKIVDDEFRKGRKVSEVFAQYGVL